MFIKNLVESSFECLKLWRALFLKEEFNVKIDKFFAILFCHIYIRATFLKFD